MDKKYFLMFQGTGSNVGKSLLVTAVCRIIARNGLKVAPFKSQNMSLNSFITKEGGEIGIAQAVQAEAGMAEPSVLMNPILIKPTNNRASQVIVKGRAIGMFSHKEYIEMKDYLWKEAIDALERLIRLYDVIIIEGAGSPAEINLKAFDIVNMRIAMFLNSPVILIGDIDKGGVFASLWGTLDLLPQAEQGIIKGLIINKFRGDIGLLRPGLKMIEEKTKKKVVGVIPFKNDLHIPGEDSLSIASRKPSKERNNIKIRVIKLPYIANATDFDPFFLEDIVDIQFTISPKDISDADIIVIPGSKNTIHDMKFLKSSGIASMIQNKAGKETMIIGICGGYQMLGIEIEDINNIESEDSNKIEGLGLLPIKTLFYPEKTTRQVKAEHLFYKCIVSGYEIHMGKTTITSHCGGGECMPLFKIISLNDNSIDREYYDGSINSSMNIWGTYIHGLFENNDFRMVVLEAVMGQKDIAPDYNKFAFYKRDDYYNLLADFISEHLDMGYIYTNICPWLK